MSRTVSLIIRDDDKVLRRSAQEIALSTDSQHSDIRLDGILVIVRRSLRIAAVSHMTSDDHVVCIRIRKDIVIWPYDKGRKHYRVALMVNGSIPDSGELITHHKDQAVLTILKVEDVIEKNFMKIDPDMDLGALTSVVAKTKRNIFPVVNAAQRLVGIVYLDDIRHMMFRQELYNRFTVVKLMRDVPVRLNIEEPMEAVMRKFEETGAWNLPVENTSGEYIGFISKSAIFTAYRKTLLDFTSD